MKQILDIREAANYLSVSQDTMYQYASEGFVPGFKLGNRWRFRISDIEKWIDKQVKDTQAELLKEANDGSK